MSTSPARSAEQPGRLLYWVLLAMGLATFVPCVLLPEWREFQAVDAARQIELHKLALLKDRVESERRMLAAMRGDPAVIGRFAQRDLRLRRADERVVQIAVPPVPAAPDERFVPEPARLPEALARMLTYLPDYDYDRVFTGDETRPIVMVMSLSLIGLAVVLFGSRRAETPSRL